MRHTFISWIIFLYYLQLRSCIDLIILMYLIPYSHLPFLLPGVLQKMGSFSNMKIPETALFATITYFFFLCSFCQTSNRLTPYNDNSHCSCILWEKSPQLS